LQRLRKPPYLQIALDEPDIEASKQVIEWLPRSGRIIIEAGTPLIKRYGTRVLNDLRIAAKNRFLVADMKTLDGAKFEVDLAHEGTADAVVAAGLAHRKTLDTFIREAKRLRMCAAVDMLNVEDPVGKLRSLNELPDIVILHRGIDQEAETPHGFELIPAVREVFWGRKLLIAVAGGIVPETAGDALQRGADIIIVGRYVTQSSDVGRAVKILLRAMLERS